MARKKIHTAESLYKFVQDELARLEPFEQRWFWQKLAAEPGYEKAEDKIGVRFMRQNDRGIKFALSQIKEQAQLRAKLIRRTPADPSLDSQVYNARHPQDGSRPRTWKALTKEYDLPIGTVRAAYKREMVKKSILLNQSKLS